MPRTPNNAYRFVVAATVLCAGLTACGGNTESGPSSAGNDGGVPLPDGDVVLPDGSVGPNPCVSSSGYAVCGGPNNCFPPAQQTMTTDCSDCYQQYYQIGICTNATHPNLPVNLYADDGEVYIEAVDPNVWTAFPYEVGALFAANGAPERVRYADWYAWTGDPLPEPTTCPTFTEFSICGGNCSPCSTGEICTGRSPHHPYGLCMPDPSLNTTTGCDATHSCPSGSGCVVIQSSADGQPFANAAGLCMPTASCQAIAANYPGGAICPGQ
jgi:hypothetical protein